MKGKIIVIEGTDGSGKKTQTQMLYERLKAEGKNVLTHSFPSYELASSGSVKMYLNGEFGCDPEKVSAKQASILFATDRISTFLSEKTGIQAHYNSGGVIIFDRYVYSNMIHQACKMESESEADEFIKWLENLEFNDLGLPRADVVFFLDMPNNVSKTLANSRNSLKAGTQKDIHENNAEHLEKAYKTAKRISQKLGWEQISCLNGNEIKTREEISDQIYDKVIKFV